MRASGDLERQLMQIVWRASTPLTGHDIAAQLDGTKNAYTTVITVLERLRTKGMLTRFRDGRSYRYQASIDGDQHTANMMAEVLDTSANRSAALLRFADALSPSEIAELRSALELNSPIDRASDTPPPSNDGA